MKTDTYRPPRRLSRRVPRVLGLPGKADISGYDLSDDYWERELDIQVEDLTEATAMLRQMPKLRELMPLYIKVDWVAEVVNDSQICAVWRAFRKSAQHSEAWFLYRGVLEHLVAERKLMFENLDIFPNGYTPKLNELAFYEHMDYFHDLEVFAGLSKSNRVGPCKGN